MDIVQILKQLVEESEYVRQKIKAGKTNEIQIERPDLYARLLKGKQAMEKPKV